MGFRRVPLRLLAVLLGGHGMLPGLLMVALVMFMCGAVMVVSGGIVVHRRSQMVFR